MSAAQAAVFFDNLTLSASQMGIAARLLEEIRNRLKFLIDVGLQYLTLDRLASTLSGGEAANASSWRPTSEPPSSGRFTSSMSRQSACILAITSS